MGAVSAKYHLAQKIVDPACWRQYESGMLTIRSLDGATDCGARDPFTGRRQRFDAQCNSGCPSVAGAGILPLPTGH
jgi:hypothetical protein